MSLSQTASIAVILLVILAAGAIAVERLRHGIAAAVAQARREGVAAGRDAVVGEALAAIMPAVDTAITQAHQNAGQQALTALQRGLTVALSEEGGAFQRSVSILAMTAAELKRLTGAVAAQRDEAAKEALTLARSLLAAERNLKETNDAAAGLLRGLHKIVQEALGQAPRARAVPKAKPPEVTPAPPSVRHAEEAKPAEEGPLRGVQVHPDDFVPTVEMRGGVVVAFGEAPPPAEAGAAEQGGEDEDPYAGEETAVFDPAKARSGHLPPVQAPRKPAVPAGASS